MTPKFRITKVDMDGYNGRDFHPTRDDEGLIVVPVKMETFFDSDAYTEEPVVGADGRLLADALPLLHDAEGWRRAEPGETNDSAITRLYTCVTEDGRVLELLDFEVEAL